MSVSRNPLSWPLTSMPQAPSPSENGWWPPAARTASLMIRAQAATISWSVSAPPYSGISLETSQPATAGWRVKRRVISAANQAWRPTIQTSLYRSRPARQAGSQFSPGHVADDERGDGASGRGSVCRSRKSANRAVIVSSISYGPGMKSGQ